MQERQRNVLTCSSKRPDQYDTPYAGSANMLSVDPTQPTSARVCDRRMSPDPAELYLAEKAPTSLKSVPSLVPGSSIEGVVGINPSAKLRGSI